MADYDQHTDSLPEGWNRIRTIGKGGQATAVHIRHKDGRDGVFRRFKRPISRVDRQRFQRELGILSQKVVHQGVVTLWDWSSVEEQPWYISELGEPFKQWWGNCKETLQDDPEAMVDIAVGVVRQIALALAECHANGVVHRDLKPQNLVMKRGVPDPWPILIDFGVAYDESSERLTATNDSVGNARFSPDVMRRRMDDVPPWLDVFDLGQILIWMLDEEAPKGNWQRPIAWNHAVYDPADSTGQGAVNQGVYGVVFLPSVRARQRAGNGAVFWTHCSPLEAPLLQGSGIRCQWHRGGEETRPSKKAADRSSAKRRGPVECTAGGKNIWATA